MTSYVFSASNTSCFKAPHSIEALFGNEDECFAIVLANDDELRILMNLLGVEKLTEIPLVKNEDFSACFDYSAYQLPQLNGIDFDALYEEWLLRSGRDSNMDEYGQLVFLQGRAASWNEKNNRYILREKT